MKKIITILGARPQFIKAALVSRELEKEHKVREIIVHTGQHYDVNMSDVFFQEMSIPAPVYYLGISGGGHGLMTGRMLVEIEHVLLKEKPDLTLLYGDTNSTLAGALASRKLNIPIAHVEGGLRNFDMNIPEDVNRIVTDRLSDIIFCPTELAMENLRKEGFSSFPCRTIKTGDLMFDAVRYYAAQIMNEKLDKCGYVLCTIHRAHNTTSPGIHETFAALNEIATSEKIILPIHPRTKIALDHYRITLHPNIEIIEPQGYLSMVKYLKNSSVVITDSGGLQKEAYALGKKSLQLMNYTPWEELITNGFSVVTEIKKNEILSNWSKIKVMEPDFGINLYGEGHTSSQIVNALVQYFN